MPDIMLLGVEDQVLELQPEDNPADSFPCMPCDGVHSELRSQLYAHLLGIFYDEAASLEQLSLELSPEGPYLFKLDVTIVERLAEIEEDDIESTVETWLEIVDPGSIEFATEDFHDRLSDFLYNLIHFCRLVQQETVLSVFIVSDG